MCVCVIVCVCYSEVRLGRGPYGTDLNQRCLCLQRSYGQVQVDILTLTFLCYMTITIHPIPIVILLRCPASVDEHFRDPSCWLWASNLPTIQAFYTNVYLS